MLDTAFLLVSLVAQVPAAPHAPPPHPPVAFYVPERVYDTASRTFVDFEVMLAALARADVVLVGEQHDDPNTHRLETAILDGLHRRGAAPILSLEMFERDVQPQIDAYVAGRTTEEEMLASARPWPRYATDYRRMVEMAKQRQWTIVAANVPRRLASEVAKGGKDALDRLAEPDRAFVARDLQCAAEGTYFDRFARTMSGHPGGSASEAEQRAALERYYWAQCLKDETMAESIAAAFEARRGGQGPVVHYTGAFHSDFGLGTPARVRRRLAEKKVVVVSILPVADLDTLAPAGEDLQRGDYLVYTIR